jgi:hypothetical protein
MAAEDGVGSFSAGRLPQSAVRYRGPWKVTIMDRDAPRVSCGRKVCRLPTSIVGWQLCVETLPQVTEQCFNGLRLQRKWARQVVLRHDNARPHSSKETTQNLTSLRYAVLPHPHIRQIWPHRTMLCSTKWKNHSAGENSVSVITRREVSATLCAVFPKTGTLQLSKSYQRDGNSA